MYDRDVFARRLKELRSRYGWEQKDLAERSGVKANTLAQYERAAACPGFDKACALADALGVSVAYLVEPIEEPRPVS